MRLNSLLLQLTSLIVNAERKKFNIPHVLVRIMVLLSCCLISSNVPHVSLIVSEHQVSPTFKPSIKIPMFSNKLVRTQIKTVGIGFAKPFTPQERLIRLDPNISIPQFIRFHLRTKALFQVSKYISNCRVGLIYRT